MRRHAYLQNTQIEAVIFWNFCDSIESSVRVRTQPYKDYERYDATCCLYAERKGREEGRIYM